MTNANATDAIDYVREYVSAMRTSSDRSRYSLYVLVVVTVLVFITNYNIQPDSWPRRRLDTWYEYARQTGRNYSPPDYVANGDAERLQAIRAEYVKQFAARVVLAPTPIPGASIDINDLGLFSGITLVPLTFILLVCVSREHENLHLSLFKVRILCREDGESSSAGDSRANLLYHALAMCQVLHSPPTLARWERHGALHYLRVIFLTPAFVYAWVFWSEWKTQYIAAQYGVTDKQKELFFELALVILLLLLGLVTWAHSSAMAQRWERVFFRINPKRRMAPQATTTEWLKLLPTKDKDAERWRERIATAVIDNIAALPNLSTDTVNVESLTLNCKGLKPSRRALLAAVNKLITDGQKNALTKCTDGRKFVALTRFELEAPTVLDNNCVLRGTWSFVYRPSGTSGPIVTT